MLQFKIVFVLAQDGYDVEAIEHINVELTHIKVGGLADMPDFLRIHRIFGALNRAWMSGLHFHKNDFAINFSHDVQFISFVKIPIDLNYNKKN